MAHCNSTSNHTHTVSAPRRSLHDAMKCLTCEVINVFPRYTGDGNTCVLCGEPLIPIGLATVSDDTNIRSGITVGVSLDGAEQMLSSISEIGRQVKAVQYLVDKLSLSLKNLAPRA